MEVDLPIDACMRSEISDTTTQCSEKGMRMRAILAGVLVALLTGCGTIKKDSLMIAPGDSKEVVAKVMGVPEDRQFKDRKEAWQYGMVASIGICDYTVIWFEDGKVTGLNSYRNRSEFGCRTGLKSLQWNEAPNSVIEIRNR